jgi:hypothetical protein
VRCVAGRCPIRMEEAAFGEQADADVGKLFHGA